MKRIEACKQIRLASSDKATIKLAETPILFRETYNPKTYIIVPSASSSRRCYVPLGFLDDTTISTNLNLIIPNATLYHFAVLTSNVHMSWMRAVCGRLGMGYRYSKDIVYNNFPFVLPEDSSVAALPQNNGHVEYLSADRQEGEASLFCTKEQASKIELTAQAILDARDIYPDASLADLYDEVTMPPEL